MKRWMKNQHLALWRGPCSKQRKARELISGPNLATGARLLSFNRTQTRDVIGLLTGHNTLGRHLHVMGLSNDPACRKCGTEEETSVHILCECEALASLRHKYLGSFFLDPDDIRVQVVGAIWNFIKEQSFYNLVQNRGQKGPVLRPRCSWPGEGPYPNYDSNSNSNHICNYFFICCVRFVFSEITSFLILFQEISKFIHETFDIFC